MKNRGVVFITIFALVLLSLLSVRLPSVRAADKVIELKFTATVPPMIPRGKIFQEWINKVEQQSQGRVKITPYWSQSLLPVNEIFRGTLRGIADISWYNPQLDASILPLTQVIYLQMTNWAPDDQSNPIWWELWEKFPALRNEWQGLKQLYPSFYGGRSWVHTTKKQVKTREDMKGMKIIIPGGNLAKFIQALGAAPVQVGFGDWFSALEKGLAEGIMMPGFGSIEAARCVDLLKYHTWVGRPIQIGFDTVIMNPDSWNKLPPDIQKIFKDLYPWYAKAFTQSESDIDARNVKETKAKGHIYLELSPEELKAWVDLAQPLHEEWIKQNKAKGSKEIYDTLQELLNKQSN